MPTAKRALQYADNGVQIPFADGLERKAERDDDVGAHSTHVLRGKVLKNGSVDKLMAIKLERSKDAGDRSRRAYSVLQRAARKGHGLGLRSGPSLGSGTGWADR